MYTSTYKRLFLLCSITILPVCWGGCDRNPVGPTPSPSGELIAVVVNGLAESLSIVELDNGHVETDALLVGQWPNHVVVAPGESLVYVVNSGDNSVQAVDLRFLQTEWSLDLGVGQNPWHLSLWGEELGCVTNFLTGELAVVDLESQQVLFRVSVGPAPEGVVVQEDRAYVAVTGYEYGSFGSGALAVVDLATGTLIRSVQLPPNAQDLVLDPDGKLHIVCTGDYTQNVPGQVMIVDPVANWSMDTVATGGSPSSIVLASDGTAFVAGYWGGLMSYDWRTGELLNDFSNPLLDREGLTAMTIDSEEEVLYLSDFDDDLLIAYDLQSHTVITTYQIGDGPVSVALAHVPTAD